MADALLVVCGASEELLHTNWSESPAVVCFPMNILKLGYLSLPSNDVADAKLSTQLAPNVEKIRLALCK